MKKSFLPEVPLPGGPPFTKISDLPSEFRVHKLEIPEIYSEHKWVIIWPYYYWHHACSVCGLGVSFLAADKAVASIIKNSEYFDGYFTCYGTEPSFKIEYQTCASMVMRLALE